MVWEVGTSGSLTSVQDSGVLILTNLLNSNALINSALLHFENDFDFQAKLYILACTVYKIKKCSHYFRV